MSEPRIYEKYKKATVTGEAWLKDTIVENEG